MRLDRIKVSSELRKRDMTQAQLAQMAGTSRQTINYVISGKRCSDEVGRKIAHALDVPVESLEE